MHAVASDLHALMHSSGAMQGRSRLWAQTLIPKVHVVQDKREKQDKLAESNLYIKNLDDSQTDDKLRQLFEVSLLSVLPCS